MAETKTRVTDKYARERIEQMKGLKGIPDKNSLIFKSLKIYFTGKKVRINNWVLAIELPRILDVNKLKYIKGNNISRGLWIQKV